MFGEAHKHIRIEPANDWVAALRSAAKVAAMKIISTQTSILAPNISVSGNPAVLGPSGGLPWLLGGSEDPWLSVARLSAGLALSVLLVT